MARIFFFLGAAAIFLGAAMAYYRISSPFLGALIVAIGLFSGFFSFIFASFSLLALDKDYSSFLFGLCCVFALGYCYYFYKQYPVNDVVSFAGKIPDFKGIVLLDKISDGSEFLDNPKKLERPYAPSMLAIQKQRHPEIVSQNTDLFPDQAFDFVVKTIKEKFPTWKITFEDKNLKQIEAEEEDEYFHFIDDIMVVISPWESLSSTIDIRSRSRTAPFDFGSNVKRVNIFFHQINLNLTEYKKTLPKQSPVLTETVNPQEESLQK